MLRIHKVRIVIQNPQKQKAKKKQNAKSNRYFTGEWGGVLVSDGRCGAMDDDGRGSQNITINIVFPFDQRRRWISLPGLP